MAMNAFFITSKSQAPRAMTDDPGSSTPSILRKRRRVRQAAPPRCAYACETSKSATPQSCIISGL
ncbi:MAG: hypothetical protein DME34_00155 [Verrucomicrobia bacterium]|nr:MAG: hypothetical protein DME34_00155 [Verrucomicrobiota bacterium]